ncbi:diguanylate cyclase domain-containing protein [Pararhodospirillum photometricum]|nr:diguanylate cyclase [Pararhodospirillum photometricum]
MESCLATRQRILIVDDERTNRMVLADLLSEDYDILLARDGEQALARLGDPQTPDLILLDVMMPGLDGYEVLRRLKEDGRTREIPVVFVTGLNDEEHEEKGLTLGATDYVSKPFHPAVVRARVRNHLDLAHRRKVLEESAYLDPLTRLANRRCFDHTVEGEWRRSLRRAQPVSLIFADVDFFKEYNDHYGHGAGDEALRIVGQALAGCVHRPHDLIARYGGEEFIVLLPETPSDAGRAIAETMRARVAAQGVTHRRSGVAPVLTISLGGYTVVPSLEGSPRQAVAVADAGLYQAKHQGRNRVVWTEG